MSSTEAQIYAQRAAERETKLREEKKKVEDMIQQGYTAQREEHQKTVEEARNKSKLLAETKKEELNQLRIQQAKELADIEAQLDAAIREKVTIRAEEGRLEVERRRDELEKKQKNLEAQAAIRRKQLDVSSEILKNGENRRQEGLNKLREDRRKELEAMNNETLEMNQKLHEARIAGEERLQQLDEKRNEEQKKQLLKKEGIVLKEIANSSALSSSLALEDGFEQFKQQCKVLRDKHRQFCFEWDSVEPELLKVHDRITKGKTVSECDMESLLGALRVFQEKATSFTSEGSTAENDFQAKIGQVIEIIRQLRIAINSIVSRIDAVMEGEADGTEKGIGENLVLIENLMKDMGELIQHFNVIGVDHIQNTLSIQMEQAQSSRHHHAITEGPPAYDSQRKSKPAAITEN